MDLNVAKEVAALRRMTVPELRAKHVALFGEETRSGNRAGLVKRLAWRMQSLAEGGLSERARSRAAELGSDADIRLSAPREAAPPAPGRTCVAELPVAPDRRLPMPGAVLTREYKGRIVTVTILPDGFEYEGEVYKSLSAVTKVITGTHWNGYHFFDLQPDGRKHA